VNLNWIILLHPLSGLVVVGLAIIVATYGWRYRNARLGKSGLDVMQTFSLQKIHKYLGISLLSLTVIVWLLEVFAFKLVIVATHAYSAIALIILLSTTATIILRFRRRRWATPVHLTLNGLIVLLLMVQLLSGLGLIIYLTEKHTS
jgi:cytochrome bd-type quinol oxidase subunit 2